jgi:DNA polymerase III delta prime subunit
MTKLKDSTRQKKSRRLKNFDPTAEQDSGFKQSEQWYRGEVLAGHSDVLSDMFRSIHNNRFPHCVILSGTASIGKSLIARRFATYLLCGSKSDLTKNQSMPPSGCAPSGCGICSSCQMISLNAHPDLHWIDLHGNSEGSSQGLTDKIREVLNRISYFPYNGIAQVVVLDHAQNISVSVANVLLKSIEEPPPGVYFIMITSSLFALPMTVRSRSAIYQCKKLTTLEVQEFLKKHSYDSGVLDIDRVASFCDGAIGVALNVLQDRENVYLTLNEIAERRDVNQAIGLAKKISNLMRDKNKIALYLTTLRLIARFEMYQNVGYTIGANSRNNEFEEPNTYTVSMNNVGMKRPVLVKQWGDFVANTIEAENLILNRHLPVEQVVLPLLLTLTTPLPITSTDFIGKHY